LENLAQAGNEIRSKLKMAIDSKKPQNAVTLAPVLKKIKVLIVDDSKTVRMMLADILYSDPQFEVVGDAEKLEDVEALIKKNRPHVITMDIHMPQMDGVEMVRHLHPIYNIPTVMISAMNHDDGHKVIRALEAGAVDFIQKPEVKNSQSSDLIRERLKVAASANLPMKRTVLKGSTQLPTEVLTENLIVIGASTGGTDALRILLEGMPSNIPPILIVQHIPPIFSAAFAHRLNGMLPFEVKEAEDGDKVIPNRVLIAPGGKQMALRRSGTELKICINNDLPVNRHKPSVDYFFRSVYLTEAPNVIAIILTGMGADGAKEMKNLRDQGARTIAQDKYSSVVYGMPKEALELGGVEFILPLSSIARKIFSLCSEKKKAA
jgi:two-component system, chemotaxis family, protein-glutamate methylesterase/glutaminase